MKTRLRAFAATELIMLLVVMGVATFVISGLMTQFAKMNKRSSETTAILEIRNRINSINKNPEAWLEKMRGQFSLYAGCIPDAKTPRYIAGNFVCPTTQSFQDLDVILHDKAGPNFHASYSPLIDMQGEILAGTDQKPVLLNLNGKQCTGADAYSTCPLKSTGFFLRSSNSTSLNPGNVQFIVKVERNIGALAKHSGVFKPEYLTIEVGTAWRNSNDAGTPSGSVKIGYLVDGNPSFINPKHQCGLGKVYVGANSSGDPICKNYPTDCGEQKSAALVSINSELICSDSGTCKDGQVFLGHFAGTGEAICNIPGATCEDPTRPLQVGLTAQGTANCVAINTCENNEKLAFDGTNFDCQIDSLIEECAPGFVVTGINSDRTLKCEKKPSISSVELECPDGKYVYGIEVDGTVKCADLITVSEELRTCNEGYYMAGINNDGSAICRDLASVVPGGGNSTTTTTGTTSTGAYRWRFTATYNEKSASNPGTTCPAGVTAATNTCTQPSRTCRRSCNLVTRVARGDNTYSCEKYTCQWVP